MKKESLMDKFVKKDYNNELELVLEQKKFEENVQSMLLSILYKIETSYKDYETVKKDVETKEEYIKEFIEIVKDYCKSIKLVKMEASKSKIYPNTTFYVDKKNGEIECYPIERKLLYTIWKISKKESLIKEKYYIINVVLSDLLSAGNTIQKVEPLRDFNGYSWTTLNTEIESPAHNLIYQILRILLGNAFLEDWVYLKNAQKDYYSEFLFNLQNKYGKENANEFVELIIKLAVILDMRFNRKNLQNFFYDKDNIENELQIMDDKQSYVSEITKRKMNLLEEIKDIDNKLNNKDLLQKEYIKRNEELPLDKKIFSMRVLSNTMLKERAEIYKKIEELNNIMKPKSFVKHVQELEEKDNYLKYLEIEDVYQETEKTLLDFQKIFLEFLKMKIEKVSNKQEIIELIYQIRYYVLLPFDGQYNVIEKIENMEECKNLLKEILNGVIRKAKETKAIQEITKSSEYEYEIWKNILQLRVIKLEDLSLKITKDKEKYFMQIFDEGAFEEKMQIFTNEKINEKQIKFNRKIKLFE